MCGIFGYAGSKDASCEVVSGLRRLDYRGYDSWGVAVVGEEGKTGKQGNSETGKQGNSEIGKQGNREIGAGKRRLVVEKQVGKIGDAKIRLPKSGVAIGHTRWATHGGVTRMNAHPHAASDGAFVLAQNGIMENYGQEKKRLMEAGYEFVSETDTEVIVRMVEEELQSSKQVEKYASKKAARSGIRLVGAVRRVFGKLEGRNTVILLSRGGQIVAARNGSPLVVGVSEQGEIYLSSDVLSFAGKVNRVLVVDNGQIVVVDRGELRLWNMKGKKLVPRWEKNEIEAEDVDKEGFAHYMLKEIVESPKAVLRVVERDLGDYASLVEVIRKARRVYTIGSGTAGNSAGQMAYYLRVHAKVHAVSLVGAEARDYFGLFGKGDVVIALSQSGETADVLEVLEAAHEAKVKIVSYVNMPGSSITRMSDYRFMAQAGPEISVASTKIFTSQLAFGYVVAKATAGKLEEGVKNLEIVAQEMRIFLGRKENHRVIAEVAGELVRKEHIFLLAKSQNWQVVREAMVKIIEESYIQAQAIPAGDLKHYAITIMERGVPVIGCVANDEVRTEVTNVLSQVKARGAMTIVVSPHKQKEFDRWIRVADTGETSAMMNIVPLQLLAYYMGVKMGHDIDKPRNIAKSVTVV